VRYRARFCNVNDPYRRWMAVCVNKRWGDPGCRGTEEWVEADWHDWDPLTGQCAESPWFDLQPGRDFMTLVTSSPGGPLYRWAVTVVAESGYVYECGSVSIDSPCTFYAGTECPPGAHCIDVPLCVQSGGRCVASCAFGCCCALLARDFAVIESLYVETERPASGTPVRYRLAALVSESTGQHDFLAGLVYEDGPWDAIYVAPCGRVRRGERCAARAPSREPGTRWSLSGEITFPYGGKYAVRFFAGHFTDGEVAEDNARRVWFEVSGSQPSPSPSPSPWQPPPPPRPSPGGGAEWLPWVLVAILVLAVFMMMWWLLLVVAVT
jgi:hypothetical protein